jgi:hypothetical protein
MKTLTKELKNQGYDLINGPIRNHKLLQLWEHKSFNAVDLYQQSVHYVFQSNVQLNEQESSMLDINFELKESYTFNVGITLIDALLKSIGFGNLELGASLSSGSKVLMSYRDVICKEVPLGEMESFLHASDFKHPNPTLLNKLNKDDLLIITGVCLAKKIRVEMHTELAHDLKLIAKLNKAAEASIDFKVDNKGSIVMEADNGMYFPIAVKVRRMMFDNNKLEDLRLISDDQNKF